MISTKNLSYKVRDEILLNNISLTIPKHKITAILGPNGAGKSTLLKCLTGHSKASEGEIFFENKPLDHYRLEELACKRAILSQSATVSFPFTVHQIVMMGRNPHIQYQEAANDYAIVQDALEAVDMWDMQDRILNSLSGGEQQRVQLARVLVQIWEQTDSYLFLDEPTSALDVKHQHMVMELAKKQVLKNRTVVMVVHDMNMALHYADEVVLLKDGELVQHGSTNQVMNEKIISEVFDIEMHMHTHPKTNMPIFLPAI